MDELPRTIELIGTPINPVLRYVDQTLLPDELIYVETASWETVVDDIKRLAVRGAPAIGVAGAAACVLAYAECTSHRDDIETHLTFESIAETIANARPTAVNLSAAVTRIASLMHSLTEQDLPQQVISSLLYKEVKAMEAEDLATNKAIGRVGAQELSFASRILTHCNAGSLATVFYGTALGVIYTLAEAGKIEHVYIDETRPLNQGARLTAWELSRTHIPATLICDDMAADVMRNGSVDAVIIGADRIARNGDVANKVGSYGLAIFAQHHNVPLYIAAPRTSFDMECATGDDILIEERDANEVSTSVPKDIHVYNPAFDIVPADLITGIICETGCFAPNDVFHAL